MGERGTQFLDKAIPVSKSIIKRLNDIFDMLMEEWRSSEMLLASGVERACHYRNFESREK